jgi:hypothetical protein|tara:strand:+ start:874 stop:1053 length:180 start_codon:yes stop_codon:yes gene_type:complete
MKEYSTVKDLQLLHTIQSKKNAIKFAEFVSSDKVFHDDFWSMTEEHQDKIYQEFLKQNK